ncbi:PREDICTED: phospholipase A2 A2-actitoxin-Ucs2a-like [Branchiostoma belcheri]|uniref:Phospholipase A2 n=1 Tax=Branchiostoma belcheri TaxID=7741 RepID=A0A6P4YD84_BRABE|nr:PREDICTED: phospholipase A2 A2-actitoxin-Ucs2a-like [Branchiostoma belcheri]
MLKLLLVICASTVFNIETNADPASVSGGKLHVRHRQKRSFVQYGMMIHAVTGRNPLDFNDYGCYCGLGGSGTPVDNIDKCCQDHDQCYDSTSLPKITTYTYIASPGSVTCQDPPGSNERAVCECDRVSALCFFAHLSEYTEKKPCSTVDSGTSTTTNQCPLDVMFLIDGSWSIGQEEFERARAYISRIVECFSNGAVTEVGVIQYYDCTPKVGIPLGHYRWDTPGLLNAIRDFYFSGGQAETEAALRYLTRVVGQFMN